MGRIASHPIEAEVGFYYVFTIAPYHSSGTELVRQVVFLSSFLLYFSSGCDCSASTGNTYV